MTLTLNATIAGFEPAAFAGATVRFTDLRDGLNGDWLVKRSEHRLAEALVTSVELKKGKEG